jgi:serine/threonine protein kinase
MAREAMTVLKLPELPVVLPDLSCVCAVILFLGACIKAPHLSMVTEYMHMGSLYRLIHSSGQGPRLSLRRRLKMLRDICRGMMCIQRMNIVHRDLKSANCLVDKHWAVKVCDFGLSRCAADAAQPGQTAVGTPEWMAPELLRSEPATYKCDVFSFGVIVWEMSTLRRPWEGLKPHQVVAAVAQQRMRLPPPPGVLGKLVAGEDAQLAKHAGANSKILHWALA